MQKNTKGFVLDFVLDMGDGNEHSMETLREEKNKLENQKKYYQLQMSELQKRKAILEKEIASLKG